MQEPRAKKFSMKAREHTDQRRGSEMLRGVGPRKTKFLAESIERSPSSLLKSKCLLQVFLLDFLDDSAEEHLSAKDVGKTFFRSCHQETDQKGSAGARQREMTRETEKEEKRRRACICGVCTPQRCFVCGVSTFSRISIPSIKVLGNLGARDTAQAPPTQTQG